MYAGTKMKHILLATTEVAEDYMYTQWSSDAPSLVDLIAGKGRSRGPTFVPGLRLIPYVTALP